MATIIAIDTLKVGPKYGPPKIIGMGWGCDRNFIFDSNCAQYWRRIYWVQPVIDFSISDWSLGVFRSAPRHLVSSTILRHCWFDWYVSLVLVVLTPIQAVVTMTVIMMAPTQEHLTLP